MGQQYMPQFRADLPAPANKWSGFPAYNFVGGHNDADSLPLDALTEAATAVLRREGQTLSTYGLQSGPLGYRPLREFIAANLLQRAAMQVDADEILITSGSLQALDLVNAVLLEPGDCVITEEATYGGTLTRLKAVGANYIGIDGDDDGMKMDQLANCLADKKSKNQLPKFIYTIPTVQNPTGTIMSKARRLEMLKLAAEYDIAIFEDDCYAALTWEEDRPPAIYALDDSGRVIYCGSFSKTIAPALRVGYLVAKWPILSRALAMKGDGGTGAVEQMLLAEYAPLHFDSHVTRLSAALKVKSDAICEALDAHFGASASFNRPKGGIFVWVTLPADVDTGRLAQAAIAEGVALNPGAEWSTDTDRGRNRLRLCFGHPDIATIRDGVARLADICHREFGVPLQSANISRT